MTLRFAVGCAGGPQSSSWKLWAQGDEAYLLQRGVIAQYQKFSFHKSGNCRWAKIQAGLSGAERVNLEWQRDVVASTGAGQGSLLLSMAFPTNHLSAPTSKKKKQIRWIEPAPRGRAVMIELFVINEDRQTVEQLLAVSGERQLLYCCSLRSGLRLCAAASQFDCGVVEINMPLAPSGSGAVFREMRFPDNDGRATGRPVRLVLMPQKHLPPTVWELGGYQTATIDAVTSA